MKLKVFFIGVLCLCVTAAEARKSLIDKVQETYKKLNDYHAEFVQTTYVSLLEKEVSERGEVSFAKGGRFRLTYQDRHGGRNYVSDGKRIAVSDPTLHTREVYRADDPQVPQEALIFLGRLASVEQFFKVKEGEEKDVLVLVPKDRRSLVGRLELKVNTKRHLVTEARLVNVTGNESRYVFKNVRTDIGLPNHLFSVD